MVRGRIKKLISVICLVCMVLALVPAPAANAVSSYELKEKLDQIKKQQDANKASQNKLEGTIKENQKQVDSLASEASGIKKEINKYNNQIVAVKEEIAAYEAEIAMTQSEIDDLSALIEETQNTLDARYEAMKRRIQYMYESGNESLITILLESGSILELLKRVEYAASISVYDRQMLDDYEAIKEQLSEEKLMMEEEEASLVAIQDELSDKKGQLYGLVADAQEDLQSTNASLATAKEDLDAVNAQKKKLEDMERELQEAYYEAQVAYAEQLAKEQNYKAEVTSAPYSSYTPEEYTLLCNMIMAEAEGEGYEGQLAVASVIMNRVLSSKFPNTITEVLYQKNQFEPVRNGRLDRVIAKGGASASCKKAADAVLAGQRNTNELFFMATWYAEKYNYYEKTDGVIINKSYFYHFK